MTKPDFSKVPVSALCFAMSATTFEAVEVQTRGPLDPYPIVIRARTGGVAYQEFWGPCVHDLAGYIPPNKPIPINYNHSRETLIGGVSDSPQVVDGELIAKGNLVPFQPDDIASEIIHKGSHKVPYQASIQLDLEILEVEFLEPNLRATVNGQEVTGPLCIFRKWGIEAVSVTPFGSDNDTSVEFSRGAGEVSVRSFSAGGSTVPVETPAGDPAKLTAFATWFQARFGVSPETMGEQQLADFAAQHTRGKDVIVLAGNDLAKQMLQDFGQQGAVWFAEGKTYKEAEGLHRASLNEQLATLRTRIQELETENTDLAQRADFRRGHQNPITRDPANGDKDNKDEPSPKNFSGHSDARQKFISSIKLPQTAK